MTSDKDEDPFIPLAIEAFQHFSDMIKSIDPKKNPLEWKLCWDMLANYKVFREERSEHDK